MFPISTLGTFSFIFVLVSHLLTTTLYFVSMFTFLAIFFFYLFVPSIFLFPVQLYLILSLISFFYRQYLRFWSNFLSISLFYLFVPSTFLFPVQLSFCLFLLSFSSIVNFYVFCSTFFISFSLICFFYLNFCVFLQLSFYSPRSL